MPRGLAFGSVSGIEGIPVEELKRTVTGVEGALKWVALVRADAEEVGVKVPVRRWPRACAARHVRINVKIYGQRSWQGKMRSVGLVWE
jgi:hypothetical protein